MFTALAFYMCFTHYAWAALFYAIGQALDAVDGTVARAFHMSTALIHVFSLSVSFFTSFLGLFSLFFFDR